jgi:hypothetical protein
VGRLSAVLCVALVALSGCATPVSPAGPIRALPADDPRPLVIVTTGESKFSVMYEGDLQLNRTLDDVLRWIPYAALWRTVAQVVQWGVNRISEAERQASTAPHVEDVTPRTVVAEAFARALMASGRVREVRILDREPLSAERGSVDEILRLSVPSWGLLRVREGKPDLLAAFADVRAQVVVVETGAVLWTHEEDVTHPERLPLRVFTDDPRFVRQEMIDVLERAGRRLASEYLYTRSAGR